MFFCFFWRFVLFQAHTGYLHLLRAVKRWSSSLYNDCFDVHKDTILKKSGVIYKYSCGRVDCGEEYIGESGRTFGERYREHMRSPSPIMDHHNTTGHEVSLDNFTIVGREDNNIARNIREAIFIRVNDPSLNRNIGKFQLPHIWDEVLARSPELHLK